MMVPDDSALIHGRVYDSAKARAYYLRTRQLKGRRSVRVVQPKGPGRPHAVPLSSKRRSARQAELNAQKAALEKRLTRLRDILAQKVKAAKARSGVKDTHPKNPVNTAAKNEVNKKNTPLTVKQKRDKTVAAKKQYQKDHGGGTSTSTEIDILKRQIADIRAKIQAAIKDAQKSYTSTHQTASKGR